MVKGDKKLEDGESERNEKFSTSQSYIKIQDLLEEIRQFEKEFSTKELEPEFSEVEPDLVNFIEIEHDLTEKIKDVNLEQKENIENFNETLKKSRIFRVKYRSGREIKKPILNPNATTFKIRFDEGGNLVNIDLINRKNKRFIEDNKKKNIKNIGEEDQDIDDVLKLSRLKRGLNKIGKLKRVIPNIRKNSEELEESEEEE